LLKQRNYFKIQTKLKHRLQITDMSSNSFVTIVYETFRLIKFDKTKTIISQINKCFTLYKDSDSYIQIYTTNSDNLTLRFAWGDKVWTKKHKRLWRIRHLPMKLLSTIPGHQLIKLLRMLRKIAIIERQRMLDCFNAFIM
jgi:hypothetical protein